MSPREISMDLEKRLTDLRKDLQEISSHDNTCPPSFEWYDPQALEKIEELIVVLDETLAALDYDPTPNHLWDDTGGEPPLSANERMAAAHQQHLEAHS